MGLSPCSLCKKASERERKIEMETETERERERERASEPGMVQIGATRSKSADA